ncbi:hypothetical protein AMECASPLE_013549 [Ameca splendens]|uniref:Uncharacterized protein n=1 Tax=Ameca splendens TaxID=208324 RepID=A0ABV0ZX67_9TELE
MKTSGMRKQEGGGRHPESHLNAWVVGAQRCSFSASLSCQLQQLHNVQSLQHLGTHFMSIFRRFQSHPSPGGLCL